MTARMLMHLLGWLFTILAFTVLLGMAVTKAEAHTTSILGCTNNVRYEAAVKVGETIMPNGLLGEAYDTNFDGIMDIVAYSYILDYEEDDNGVTTVIHHEHPMLYVVDLDYDNVPDATYVDKGPGGVCDDIVLYEDLRHPSTPDVDKRKSDGNL